MAKKMYGYDYDPIPTDVAKKAIKTNTTAWEDTYVNDCEWWQVATMDNGDVMWMDNLCGIIIILTNEDISYYRYF